MGNENAVGCLNSTKAWKDRRSLIWVAGCVVCTALVMAAAFAEIRRVEHGSLFALSLPWDDEPSDAEVLDARMSAKSYLVPALLFLAVLGPVATLAIRGRVSRPVELSTVWRALAVAFLLAVMADLATTLWFFHVRGIDYEVHPAIRLFGYAYGRTIGPVAGKAVQAAGVLAIAVCLPRGGRMLLLVVTLMYVLGAAYNVWQM